MKLAHNEQCIALYPLTTHYSVGRFQPVLTFGLQGPIYSWAHFHIRLLTAHYCHFLLVGQIQPVVTFGPFVAR